MGFPSEFHSLYIHDAFFRLALIKTYFCEQGCKNK
jgi:hypothetical protein